LCKGAVPPPSDAADDPRYLLYELVIDGTSPFDKTPNSACI
jgi:hypothetical protein